MAVQYGKCTNRAGCTLAYTGDQVRFEGDPICPECGQPLVVIKGPGGSGNKLWLLILLPVVLIGMVAAGYFIVQGVLGWGNGGGGKASPSASAVASASPSATPTASVSATSPSTTPEQSPSPGASSPEASPNAPSPGASPSGSGGSVDSHPQKLSDSDIEATRKQVLTRLQAMPGKSQQEKDKLADKVQTARSMERLQVIFFEIGRSMIAKPQVDQLVASLNDPKMKEKMSDPTLVFVVAGYADKSSGNPGINQSISNARAENIARIMKQAGVTNVIHTVAMGGTDVLENTRPDQNRAVEIWSVVP
jgi:outer membrane protein OmpA-like peptidoglycan-associated protein